MSVSDLTGTTWIWNDQMPESTIDYPPEGSYDLIFSSNGNTYTSLEIEPFDYGFSYYNSTSKSTTIYEDCQCIVSDAYKTIEITGGTEVTNADLISFLESNATQKIDAIIGDPVIIASGSGGGTDTSDATLSSANQMLSGITAYAKGTKYTGSIPTIASASITASGSVVTIPSGYYSSQYTKSISAGTATTPATSISVTPSITINTSGLITAANSSTRSVTPTIVSGYVSAGTAGTITVNGSNTKQLTTKAATTYTPSTTAQTIASQTFLTGTQTISGDANLLASNIKSGVSIFGVTGTYEGSGGGMVVVETQDSHGGTIVEITGDQISLQSKTGYQQKDQTILTPDEGYSGLSQVILPAWYPNGPQPELVTTMATTTYNLSTDTSWDTWDPVKTATSIKASATLGTFKANSMASYDYLIEWTYDISFAFTSGAPLVSLPYRTFVRMYQHITRRPSNLANLDANTFNGNVCITGISVPMILYYSSGGVQTLGWSGSYTVYPSIAAATFSSSTAASPTVTVKLPAIYARCNDTYFPVANAGYIDSANTNLTIGCKVYRTAGTGIERATYQLGVNDYLDTLS